MIKFLRFKRSFLFSFLFVLTVKSGFSQDWTSVKGSTVVNVYGVYGSPNSTITGNNPGSRNGAANWTDNSGNLWLFGGDGYALAGTGRMNDMWRYTIATNQWTWISGTNIANMYAVYGTQGTASSTVTPGGRAYGLNWKDASGNLWLFGGEGYDVNGTFGNLNDLWKFNVTTAQWTWVSGSKVIEQPGVYGTQGTTSVTNVPGARRLSTGWTDASGNLWLFGGFGLGSSGSDNPLSDLWKFNVTTSQWTWISGSSVSSQLAAYGTLGVASTTNIPGGRYGCTSWKDASNNFWICNGHGYTGSGSDSFLSDIWMYNTVTNQWMWVDGASTNDEPRVQGIKGISTASTTPGARYYSASWTDASGNLYLHGGNSTQGNFGDLWRYNITTHNWTWLRGPDGSGVYGTMGTSSPLNEPGASYLRSYWKDNSSNFWLFGGVGYDAGTNFSDLNELWKTSLPATAPTASFSINQTANVCLGTRVIVTNLSTNSPAAFDYYIDGTFYSYDKDPVLQNPPTIAGLTSGTHTISLTVANSAGVSSPFTKTISVSPLTASTITRTPAGIYTLNIGSGQTNNSDWSPWVYNFTDPLPAGVTITGVDLAYNGVDQGYGGSGAPGVIHFADQQVANAAFTHNWTYYTNSVTASFPNYNYGGNNTVKLYFWGYPGWQGFLSGLVVYIHYETSTIPVCPGGTVALTAASGGVRAWTGGVVEGVPFIPASSGIYTVTSTEGNGCVSTHTIGVAIQTPTIVAYGGEICSGNSFIINASGANTYTYSGGSNVVSPTGTTTYSITGKSIRGCAATNTAVITVTVDATPSINVTSGTICSGKAFTITASGATTYSNTTQHLNIAATSTVSPSSATNYYIIGSNANGCVSNAALASVALYPVPQIGIISSSVCAGKTNTLSLRKSFGLRFDGYDDLGYMPISYLNDFSMEFWMRTTQVNGGTPGVDSWRNGNSILDASVAYDYQYDMGTSLVGGKLAFGIGNTDTTIYSTSSVNTGNWVHVAVTWQESSGQMSLYINGVLEANGAGGAGTPRSFYNLVMGSNVYNTSFYSGDLDDVRIWNEARTLSEVQNDMNSCLTGNETNLFASYQMEEGPGANILYDQSPNSLTTYLYNMDFQNAWVTGAEICGSGGAYTSYSWSPGGSTSASFTINPVSTTVYTLSVVDGNSCTTSASSTIVPYSLPVVTASDGTVCSSGSFTINPSGADTYTYSSGPVVSPTVTTNYSVTGTDSFGCKSAPATVVHVLVDSPTLTVAGSNTVCSGSSLTQTVSGASTYLWNDGTTTNTISLTPPSTATYVVTGTNTASGCSASAIKVITVNITPTVSATGSVICSGKSFTIVPSGALSYTYSSGPVVSPTTTTSYFVSGTSSLNCVSASAAAVTVSVNPTPGISVSNGTICLGKVFTMVPSGASTYTYSNGSSTVSPASNASYSITGTSALGCISFNTAVASVTVNALPVLSVSGNTSVCFGSFVIQTVSGASTYSWSSSQTTNTISVSPAANTTYTVTGTDAVTTCSNTATKSITVNPLPTINVNSGVICSNNSFTMTPSGASTYTYSSGTGIVSPTTTTNYSVTGTDILGCVSAGAAVSTVSVNTTPTLSVPNGTVCAGKVFSMIPSGASTYTYSNGSSTVVPAGNASYSITGTSSAGCISFNTVVASVTVNALPVLSVSGNTSVCFGSFVIQTVSGASTYSWSSSQTTNTISVSPAANTTYTVTGTDAVTTCSNTATKSITVNPLPTVNVNSGVICSNNSFTMTPSGASTYTYSSGTGIVSPTATTNYSVTGTDILGCVSAGAAVSTVSVNTTPTLSVPNGTVCAGKVFSMIPSGASTYTYSNGSSTVVPAGNASYSITGTSSAGCISFNTVVASVTVNALPVLSVSGNTSVCFGSFVTQTVSGAGTYSWSSSQTTNTVSLNPAANTTYTVTGTDAVTTCSNTATKSITVNPLPTVNVNSGVICSNNSFTMTPSGASTYTYSSGTGIVSPTTTTNYSVTGTDILGCVSAGAAVSTVSVNTTPTLSVPNGTVCAGKVFSMIPSGANTYTYSNGSSTVVPAGNTSYSITGTSSAGCISFNTVVASVTVNALPVLSVSGNTSVCFGSFVTQTVSGASTYSWSSSQTTNTVSLNPAANTTYTVTGTDAITTCSNTATKSITVNPLPTINVNSGVICSNNSFTMTPSGASTYTYSSGTGIVSPTTTTNYSVTGTDILGCVSAGAAVSTVTVNTTPTVTINSGAICRGDGFVFVPGGGVSTYTITGGSSVVSPTATSSYSVTGTSTANCISANTAVATITVNLLPVLSISGASVVCHGSTVTQTISGAGTYVWSTGASSSTVALSPTVTSSYSVTGIDNFTGCFSIITETVSVSPQPTLSVNSGTLCSGRVYTMTPSGASTYTYSSGSSTIAPLSTTSYSVIGTNTLGCVSASPAISTVTVFTSPVIGVSSGSVCPGSPFTMVPGGAATYTFYNGFATVSPLSTTSYSVIGTSTAGCISSNVAVSTITVVAGPVLSVSGNTAICNGSPVTLTVSGSSTYTWSTGSHATTITVSPTVATTYTVSSINLTTGCFGTTLQSVSIGVPPAISVNSGNLCAGKAFTLTPSGAATYTFSNGTGTVTAIVTPTANTNYFVTGTSSQGCVSAGPAIANVIVNQPPVISVNSGSICSGQSFTITPSGANTYTFVNGGTVVNPASSASYSVFGIDVLGCVSNTPAIASVTVNPVPSVSASNGTVCTGSSYTIVPAGAFTYTYSSGSNIVTPLANANYSVTGTSSAGCISSGPAVLTVSIVSLPVIGVNNGTVCPGAIFTMTPSGAATYTYSNGSSTVIPNGFITYSVTGTSAGGCVSAGPAVATVSIASIPFITVNSGTVCSGQVFTISSSGAYSYTYSSGSQTVSPQTSASYTVTGSSIYGCAASNTAIAGVTALVTPTIFVAGNMVICSGQSVALNAMGAGSYTWSGTHVGTTLTTTLAADSAFIVEGSDVNGCIGTTVQQVTVNPLPVITAGNGTVCPGGAFTITPSGATTYTYSSGTAIVTPTATASYSITGTDANGCVSIAAGTLTVNVENAITISVTGPTLVCSGSPAGLTANGGSTYTWSTGDASASIAPTPTAVTSYTVVGSNGACADTAVVSVAVNALPVIAGATSASVICAGETVTLSVTGAESYTWTSGEQTNEIVVTPTATMVYSVSATGTVNSCVAVAAITQSVGDCTGIKEQDPDGFTALLNLYPNPNSGSFIVETSQEMTLTISDSPGQVVLIQKMSAGKNFVTLGQYAKGIYFAGFKTGKIYKTFKVIID